MFAPKSSWKKPKPPWTSHTLLTPRTTLIVMNRTQAARRNLRKRTLTSCASEPSWSSKSTSASFSWNKSDLLSRPKRTVNPRDVDVTRTVVDLVLGPGLGAGDDATLEVRVEDVIESIAVVDPGVGPIRGRIRVIGVVVVAMMMMMIARSRVDIGDRDLILRRGIKRGVIAPNRAHIQGKLDRNLLIQLIFSNLYDPKSIFVSLIRSHNIKGSGLLILNFLKTIFS